MPSQSTSSKPLALRLVHYFPVAIDFNRRTHESFSSKVHGLGVMGGNDSGEASQPMKGCRQERRTARNNNLLHVCQRDDRSCRSSNSWRVCRQLDCTLGKCSWSDAFHRLHNTPGRRSSIIAVAAHRALTLQYETSNYRCTQPAGSLPRDEALPLWADPIGKILWSVNAPRPTSVNSRNLFACHS
jgi:hypothetical protein